MQAGRERVEVCHREYDALPSSFFAFHLHPPLDTSGLKAVPNKEGCVTVAEYIASFNYKMGAFNLSLCVVQLGLA